MKAKTLPCIRIEEDEFKNIERAVEKFNSNSIVEMNLQGFRRFSYRLLSQMILTGQEIPMQFVNGNNAK